MAKFEPAGIGFAVVLVALHDDSACGDSAIRHIEDATIHGRHTHNRGDGQLFAHDFKLRRGDRDVEVVEFVWRTSDENRPCTGDKSAAVLEFAVGGANLRAVAIDDFDLIKKQKAKMRI